MGLFCSTSAQHIAPVAGGAGLIQLSAANSPLFSSDLQEFPHLWRILVSAEAYAEMMLSLMRRFGWKKVGVVQDLGTIFHSGIAKSFVDLINGTNDEYIIKYHGGILHTRDELIDTALDNIKTTGTRIVFLQTTGPQTAKFLCAAANKGMFYDNYLWIITDFFLTGLIGELKGLSNCNEELLRKGINGSLIGFFDLQDTEAIFTNASGFNYSEYQHKYLEELNVTRKEYYSSDDDVGDVLYAGLLYDQVWALALAINNAIEQYNISMEDYSYDQYEVTDKIEESLRQVSFRGATGHIMFSERREVSTPINIYQVNSYASEPHVQIGYYDSYHKRIYITTNNLPNDIIETKIISIPFEVAIVLYVAVLSVAIIVTIVLVCLLYHRSKPPVKATSPFVSLLMFLGCYLFLLNDFMRITYASFPHIPDIFFEICCNAHLLLYFNGCSLVFLTLLIRLIRIRKIFYNKRLSKHLSPFWSNKILVIIVILMTVFPNTVIVLWTSLDESKRFKIITNNRDGPLLYNEEVDICRGSGFGYLYIVMFLYLFIIFIATIITASRTRKIKHKDFKDTKKVNAFIYVYFLTFTFMACSVIYFNFVAVRPILAQYFAISFSLIIVCECVFILFLPKLISLLFINDE